MQPSSVIARKTLPMLRVRAEPDGRLIPVTSLAPWQRGSEAWWADVLHDPRARRRKKPEYDGPQTHLLEEVRLPTVDLTCTKCELRRAFSTAELLDQYGADHSLPGLLPKLAIASGCQRAVERKWSDWCGAHYVNPVAWQ